MASAKADTPSTSGATDYKADDAKKQAERLKKLRDLQMKRNEARKLNHQEVVEEDRKKKLPANWEARRMRVDWEEEDDKKRKQCETEGIDYERAKMLEMGAEEAERYERRSKRKKNPDVGFSTYEDMTIRQYNRLTKTIKADLTDYEERKAKLGDAFYPSVDTLGLETQKDSKEAVDNLVQDLEKQSQKRSKYSRRRTVDDDGDIDYINTSNAKFNKKLERFYGKYTTEIKQNLERGTAV